MKIKNIVSLVAVVFLAGCASTPQVQSPSAGTVPSGSSLEQPQKTAAAPKKKEKPKIPVYVWPPDKNFVYGSDEEYRRCRPEESFDTLVNPHRGIATFQHFNGDPLFPGWQWSEEGPLKFDFESKVPEVIPGYVKSTVSYCRWYWKMFEPERGKYDWSMVEGALKMCKLRGQTLQVRLMPAGYPLPDWYKTVGKITKSNYKGYPDEPDYNTKEYFELWEGVVKSFSEKFRNDPYLDTFDISFEGPWGEGAGNMKKELVDKIMEMYLKYFSKEQLLVNIDGYQFESGIARGMGWRCDCWGDMRNTRDSSHPLGLGWNHTFDAYPKTVFQKNATDTWKNCPVVLETCHNPAYWYEENLQEPLFEMILQQGLKFHSSVIMPKYSYLPEKYLPRMAEFEKKLGYRFVYRQTLWQYTLSADKKFTHETWLENVGIAPLYKKDYKLAFRFSQGKITETIFSGQDLTKCMPGDTWIEETLQLKAAFVEDEDINMDMAIVNAKTGEPAIKLAIKDVGKDGWYGVGKVIYYK